MAKQNFSLDDNSKKSRKSSGSGDSEGGSKKIVMICVAAVCLLGAVGVTAWQYGLFAAEKPEDAVAAMGPAAQEVLNDPKQQEQVKRQLEIMEEKIKKNPPSGS